MPTSIPMASVVGATGSAAAPVTFLQQTWARIRGRRLSVVLRCQVPLLASFIADFPGPTQGLVVEIDGGYHGEQAAADSRRDLVLTRDGYRMLRPSAALVEQDIETAVALDRAALGP